MSYARNRVLNKRLPAFVGFFVLLFALGLTILLSGNTFLFVSRATVGADPKNVQISNITDTSFTISYLTDAPAQGTISYGTDPSTANIALDDRDQQASGSAEHQMHEITVKNLLPATKYYFVIDSGSQKAENNGQPFEIMTAAGLPTQSIGQPQTISGDVALSDGSIPAEAIIYVTGDTIQQLATLTNPDGSYQIPLPSLRSNTLDSLATLTPDTVLQLQVFTPTQQSTVKLLASQINPVPKIVLAQDYDFTLGPSQPSSGSAQIASGSGFPVFTTPAPVSSPEITTPTNAQAFKDQKPLFVGRALPDTEVDITIKSQQEISAKLQSDDSGSWQFRPPVSLAPGKHTITIQSVDTSGIVQTIERSFTVYASGSQFIEPSVSPILPPTATPTAQPTPTTALTPTAAPTPTTAVTPTPAPTSAVTPVPVPKTGSSAVITGVIAGIAALGIGALLFIVTVV